MHLTQVTQYSSKTPGNMVAVRYDALVESASRQQVLSIVASISFGLHLLREQEKGTAKPMIKPYLGPSSLFNRDAELCVYDMSGIRQANLHFEALCCQRSTFVREMTLSTALNMVAIVPLEVPCRAQPTVMKTRMDLLRVFQNVQELMRSNRKIGTDRQEIEALL